MIYSTQFDLMEVIRLYENLSKLKSELLYKLFSEIEVQVDERAAKITKDVKQSYAKLTNNYDARITVKNREIKFWPINRHTHCLVIENDEFKIMSHRWKLMNDIDTLTTYDEILKSALQMLEEETADA